MFLIDRHNIIIIYHNNKYIYIYILYIIHNNIYYICCWVPFMALHGTSLSTVFFTTFHTQLPRLVVHMSSGSLRTWSMSLGFNGAPKRGPLYEANKMWICLVSKLQTCACKQCEASDLPSFAYTLYISISSIILFYAGRRRCKILLSFSN